jgi:hypothetical protein
LKFEYKNLHPKAHSRKWSKVTLECNQKWCDKNCDWSIAWKCKKKHHSHKFTGVMFKVYTIKNGCGELKNKIDWLNIPMQEPVGR